MSALTDRNDAIVAAYMRGETRAVLARQHGISVTRVAEIINRAAVRATALVDDFPRSLWEGVKDWQRGALEYVANAHAADPDMARRRAAVVAAARDEEIAARREWRKIDAAKERERIRAQNEHIIQILEQGRRTALARHQGVERLGPAH